MKYGSTPTDLFKKAHNFYLNKDFKNAIKIISEYKRCVRYDLFKYSDRRDVSGNILITVIIVSFGANEALLECIDSLVLQNDEEYEVIVVDNGSNDKIKEELNEYSILHITPPINFFPSEGRNIGAHFAKGRYLAFLDDDATVPKNYIKTIKAAWETFNFSGIRGKILPKSNSGNNLFMGHYDFGNYPIPAILMTEGNMVIRRDVFDKIGGFDPLIFGGEGTELSFRCNSMI